MDFYTRALAINQTGWRVLNCFQFGDRWQVNLQMYSEKGASLETFSEYAQGDTPLEALEAAFVSAKARHPKAKPTVAETPDHKVKSSANPIPPALEARLVRALQANFFAVKMNGTGSGNRTSDL